MRATSGQYNDTMLRFPARMKADLAKLPVLAVIERVGDDPDVRRLTPEAVQKQLRALSSVLGWACRNDYIESNPAEGIKPENARSDDEKRLPYDTADLELIFGSEVIREGPTDPTKRGANF